MRKEIPNPGSDEARKQGCNCPVLDNDHGIGGSYKSRGWIIRLDCKLHGDEKIQNRSNKK